MAPLFANPGAPTEGRPYSPFQPMSLRTQRNPCCPRKTKSIVSSTPRFVRFPPMGAVQFCRASLRGRPLFANPGAPTEGRPYSFLSTNVLGTQRNPVAPRKTKSIANNTPRLVRFPPHGCSPNSVGASSVAPLFAIPGRPRRDAPTVEFNQCPAHAARSLLHQKNKSIVSSTPRFVRFPPLGAVLIL